MEQNNSKAAQEGTAINLDIQELASKGKEIAGEISCDINQRLNVLIVGKTGVGKSTLINAIFGANVVKTGSGEPVSKEINEIKISDKFYIYDSKGLEMKDFEQTYADIENFLKENE